MGATNSTSVKKENETWEIHSLSESSINDRTWLGVTEENLFNESFTNEKYYMLNSSRELDDGTSPFASKSEKGTNISKREEQLLARKLAESYMIGIVEQDPQEQYSATINKIVQELLGSFNVKSTYYDTVLQRRISILKRIHLAHVREQAREKILVSSFDNKTNKQKVSNMVRMTIRLFIAMIQEQKAANICEATITTLNSILKEFDFLSLQDEPEDCLEAYQNWLLKIITDQKSDYSIELKNEALEALILLALSTGSLVTFLSAIYVLITSSSKKISPENQFIKIPSLKQYIPTELNFVIKLSPLLKKLFTYQVELVLTPISQENLSSSWTINWSDVSDPNSSIFLAPSSATNISTITCNSSFLFLHDRCGLAKIGTGFLSENRDCFTIRGKVYIHIPDWHSDEKGWLACVGDKLYYRSHSILPAILLILNTKTLQEEGKILVDGTGSIPTEDNSNTSLGGKNIDPEQKLSPMFSDGRYLYFLVQKKSHNFSVNKFYVDAFDPCMNLKFIKRIKLRYPETKKNTMSSLLNSQHIDHVSYYTNGHYLVIVIPPPLATDYNYDSKTYLCRSFNLRDGTLVGNFSLENHPIGGASCYDFSNNVIWNYHTQSAQVAEYFNEGIAPSHVFPDQTNNVPELFLPNDESEMIPASDLILSILSTLDRLSSNTMPSAREKKIDTLSLPQRTKLKDPFCVQIHPETFGFLFTLLQHCKNTILETDISEKTRIQFLHYLLHLLRVTKLNTFRLATFIEHSKIDKKSISASNQSISTFLQSPNQHPVMLALRDLLFNIANIQFQEPQSNSNSSEAKPSLCSQIRQEACEVFTVGMPLFFTSNLDQAKFILNLLNSNSMDSPKQSQLLEFLLNYFVNHIHSSYLVLPPESIHNEQGEGNDVLFDPNDLFIPIINHLIKRTQQILMDPSIKEIRSIQENFTASLPPLRVLVSIQKDLFMRAAHSRETDINLQSLVIYSKLVFENCKSIFQSILENPPESSEQIEESFQLISLSASGTLLPTVVNALFLFSSNSWLGKELLPSIVQLIDLVDKLNSLLPPILPSKLFLRPHNNDLIEGPSKTSETLHPYVTSHTQVVTIPGAVFLALVFDEHCCTSNQFHYLQLFADIDCTIPIGDPFYGPSSRWPKHRILVHGDTVVFNFHIANDKSKPSISEWGYRCIVIGHLPQKNQQNLPWSIHLEKTLCCLGGHISAALISGPELCEAELNFKFMPESEILKRGIEESKVNEILPSSKFEINWKDLDQEVISTVQEKELFEQEIQIQKEQQIDNQFFDQLEEPNSNFAQYVKWVEQHLEKSITLPIIKQTQDMVFAVLLKFTGLLSEAIQTIQTPNPKPPSAGIIKLWEYLKKVKFEIFQQQQQEIDQYESSAASTNNNSSMNTNTSNSLLNKKASNQSFLKQDKEKSYKEVATKIYDKAKFLLIGFHPQSPSMQLAVEVLNYLFHSITKEETQKILSMHRSRAFSRAFGLQAMHNILKKAEYLSMKHEALSFLGPALRNSGWEGQTWPHHFTDNIELCGIALFRVVRNTFVSLLKKTANILRDDQNDSVLQLHALNSWILSFQPVDHSFLFDINIFKILFTRISTENNRSNSHLGDKDFVRFELSNREKLNKSASNLFLLLGAICLSTKQDSNWNFIEKSDPLQESFFTMMACQLEESVQMYRNELLSPIHPYNIFGYKRASLDNLRYKKNKFPQKDPSSEDIDWLGTISFLYTLSVSSVARGELASPRFLEIFFSLLRMGDVKLQLLILRLFKRIFPPQDPSQLPFQKGGNFIDTFFEQLGSIYFLAQDITQLSHQYSPVEYFISTLVPGNILNRMNRFGGKGSTSHPYFPFNDYALTLPSCWDRKSAKGQVSFSDDLLSINFHHSTPEDDLIGVVRTDVIIPDGLKLFYFEIRIDNEGDDGRLAIGLYPADQKLRGMPGWYNGSYAYHGDDGNKFSYLLDGKGESYGPKFAKGNIVGCGWNIKDGTIFFTMDGEYLGTAFKNVFGTFYPVVGANSRGAALTANFGQNPFQFNFSQLPQLATANDKERTGQIGHMAISFASESIILLRHLLQYPKWRDPLLQSINASLDNLPLIIKNLTSATPSTSAHSPPSSLRASTGSIPSQGGSSLSNLSLELFPSSLHYGNFCKVVASLSILGANIEGIRVGAQVEIDGYEEKESGVVIEYSSSNENAVVFLKTEQNIRVLKVSSLKPISILSDPNLLSEIFSNKLSSFLPLLKPFSFSEQFPPTCLHIYYHLKLQIIQILDILCSNSNMITFLMDKGLVSILVQLAQEGVDEIVKINTLERRVLLLKEHLFEIGSAAIIRQSLQDKLMEKVKDNSRFLSFSKKKVMAQLDVFFGIKPKGVSYNLRTSMNDMDFNEGSNSNFQANQSGVQNLNQVKPNIAIVVADVPRIKWKDLRIGLYLMVIQKDAVNSPDWVDAMDSTIGHTGLVKLIDIKTKQVLLNFYDSPTGHSQDWWFSYRVLGIPDPKSIVTDPFQRLKELSLHEILDQTVKLVRACSILYARNAAINIVSTIPAQSKSIICLGGPQNIVNLLKLPTYEVSPMLAVYDTGRIKKSDLQKRLAKSVSALLRYEALQNMIPQNSQLNLNKKPEKSGLLRKQGKILGTWKTKWCVLQGYYLSWYRDEKSSQPMGMIDFSNDMMVIGSTSFRKDISNTFQIVTAQRTIVFKAKNAKEREDWVQKITETQVSSIGNRPRFSNSSLSTLLTKEVLWHFSGTVNDRSRDTVVEEESSHPHGSDRIIKLIRIQGAEKLLVIFDISCDLQQYNILKFYQDVDLSKLICAFSGKGPSSFPPTIIEGDRFWMSFNPERSNTKWGYKFYVTPLQTKHTDEEVLKKPNFNFAYSLSDWLLNLVPLWMKPFYSVDIFTILINHLFSSSPQNLDRRTKVIVLLTRLLKRWREFSVQPDIGKLKFLKDEMIELHANEVHLGESVHSVYLQHLVELNIQVEIVEEWQQQQGIFHPKEKEEMKQELPEWQTVKESLEDSFSNNNEKGSPNLNNNNATPISHAELKSSGSSSSIKQNISPNNLRRSTDEREDTKKEKKRKAEEENRTKKSYTPPRSRTRSVTSSWFNSAVSIAKVLDQLTRGGNFPSTFIKNACMDSLKQVVTDESPHPYPQGVRVTSTIQIHGATQLLVTFDPRSRIHSNLDYLMFSKHYAGGDDIGLFTGEFPAEVTIPGDTLIWSFFSDTSVQSLWGFKFTVQPIFSDTISKELESQVENEYQLANKLCENWNLIMDSELVKLINSCCQRQRISAHEFSLDRCDPSELQRYTSLSEVPMVALAQRVKLLKYFNSQISQFLPLVDLKNVSEEWSLAYLVYVLRGLIFYNVKTNFLNDVLQRNGTFLRRAVVPLDRSQNKLKEECLFLQGFHVLSSVEPIRLRQNDRAFEIQFVNEGAQDMGGPYQEAMTQFTLDFQNKDLGLFLPCPNATDETGFNQEKLIPNSAAISPSKLAQFEFIGRLIGIAIRTRNYLNLHFPSIVWKTLVGSRLDRNDLESIDKRCCQSIDYLRHIASHGINEKNFNDYIFETFTTRSSSGKIIELKPGGSKIPVTWTNRNEYVTLLEQYRLNEFNTQTDSIFQGVASILPSYLLHLFTWQELEFRVCGNAGIDVHLLQKNTEYVGCSSDDPHIINFWKTLKSFTPEEQSLFLRFVSGRARLPVESEWTSPFQIHAFTKDIEREHDNYLPEAHTCFFTIVLPSYSTIEVMKEKLLYAINTCKEIDTDFVVSDILQDEDLNNESASESEEEEVNQCITS